MPAQGGLRILSSDGAIKPIGTWGLSARAGDFVFVAGMRGIDLANNAILGSEEERIRQAFTNMKGGPYPPRTILEVAKFNQDNIFEMEGTFSPQRDSRPIPLGVAGASGLHISPAKR